MPWIHTCYSLRVTCFFLVRRMPVRVAWLLYPVLIVFSIVATGNHFLDDRVGATTAVIALGAAWLIESWHPTLPTRRALRMHLAPISSDPCWTRPRSRNAARPWKAPTGSMAATPPAIFPPP